jgi:multisubunit Na+/H+ antiporter MnhE subunit
MIKGAYFRMSPNLNPEVAAAVPVAGVLVPPKRPLNPDFIESMIDLEGEVVVGGFAAAAVALAMFVRADPPTFVCPASASPLPTSAA